LNALRLEQPELRTLSIISIISMGTHVQVTAMTQYIRETLTVIIDLRDHNGKLRFAEQLDREGRHALPKDRAGLKDTKGRLLRALVERIALIGEIVPHTVYVYL